VRPRQQAISSRSELNQFDPVLRNTFTSVAQYFFMQPNRFAKAKAKEALHKTWLGSVLPMLNEPLIFS